MMLGAGRRDIQDVLPGQGGGKRGYMEDARYLTKFRFTLATECPAKLFYTGKGEYANQALDNPFLAALAEGGFQVGELAKCYFAGGHEVTALDYDQALADTEALLDCDQVTIYEAAIAADTLFVRADILVKRGSTLNLYEVKSKSFDPDEDDPFTNHNGTIRSVWKPYLYDVAFQKHVITRAFPHYQVSAHLVMADKTIGCPTDGLNQKFRLTKDPHGRTSVSVSPHLTTADLTPQILCTVNVDEQCDHIYADAHGSEQHEQSFTQWVDHLARHYATDTKIVTPVSTACSSCQFHTTATDERQGRKSGRKECWKDNLAWRDEDFDDPTVLDVWNFRKKSRLLAQGCIKMCELTEEDVAPKPDQRPGLSASERQWLQVDKHQNNDTTIWLDQHNLAAEMARWTFPLHFIDFETTMAAIPFNAGRKPYEGIAFQFSHHVVDRDGSIQHAGQYLNTRRGVFPNYDFLRALKAELHNDNGTIFRYSNHENTFLNMIYRQLHAEDRDIADRDELCAFIRSITKSVHGSEETWVGQRSMVDMWELVKRYYYDPATGGSNSIKHVLPAILNSSSYLQDKYAQPLYGTPDGISSLNFTNWQWIRRDEDGHVQDPYKLLPKMFQDISDKDMDILSNHDELRDGGAALTAYARMQFEDMSPYEHHELRSALLKYCELDTLAMVMLYEGWKDLLAHQTAPETAPATSPGLTANLAAKLAS